MSLESFLQDLSDTLAKKLGLDEEPRDTVEILGNEAGGGMVWLRCLTCGTSSEATKKMTTGFASRWAKAHLCERPEQ